DDEGRAGAQPDRLCGAERGEDLLLGHLARQDLEDALRARLDAEVDLDAARLVHGLEDLDVHRVDARLASPLDATVQAAAQLPAEVEHPLLVEREQIVAEVDAAHAVAALELADLVDDVLDRAIADLAAEDVVRAAVDAAVRAAARREHGR